MTQQPVKMGVAGMGGYAGSAIVQVLENAAAEGSVQLVAVCDPDVPRHANFAADLKAKGVTVLDSFDQLLAQPIEAVWLPVPIDLHRPYTLQALEAGKAVLCEKPAAGCVDDVDAMIAARDRASLPVIIGYQDIYDEHLLGFKSALLDGTIGKIKRASVFAAWARNDAYFARNDWAGKFKHRGTWVLDSPANNAMSHHVNLPLFLLGSSLLESAEPVRVQAELYRARPIENYDTASMRIELPGGVELILAMTHAVDRTEGPVYRIEGDAGVATVTPQEFRIEPTGQAPQVIRRSGRTRSNLVTRFADLVRGRENPSIALATLETARAPIVVICAASQVAPIATIPESQVRVVQHVDGHGVTQTFRSVIGMNDAMRRCGQEFKLLSELGTLDWTHKPSAMDTRGYKHFAGPAGAADAQPAGAQA